MSKSPIAGACVQAALPLLLSMHVSAGPMIVVTTPLTTNLDDEDAVVLFDNNVEIRNESTVTTNGQSADGLRTSGIGANVVNTSGGEIITTGDNFAVGIRTAGDEISIENVGSITTDGINGDGIVIFGNRNDEGLLISRDPNDFVGNTVVNSGTVEVNGVGADGFVVEGDRTTLTNTGSIVTNAGVRDGNDNGTGAYFAGFENHLNNAGLIESTGLDSTAVRISNESSIVNTGSIVNSGASSVGNPDFAAGTAIFMVLNSALTNAGSIQGDVVGGFGAQRVELRAGSSIEGTVDVSVGDAGFGAALTDELVTQLSAGESLAIAGDEYVGFDTLSKTGAGTLQLGGTLTLTENAQGRIEEGKLELDGGGLVLNDLLVSNGGELAGNGSVFGDIFVEQGGIVGPGFSPGRIDVTGNLNVGLGGILRVEFAGLGSGQFDFLNITGIADLTGAIVELNFLDPFLPSALDSIDFLSASSIVGLQDAVFRTPGVSGDFDFAINNGVLGFTALSSAKRVPAPATLALLVLGWLGLTNRARKRGHLTVARRLP